MNIIDPDTIFPEVESCNLEEIFDQRKLRYARNTSSGNWTNDKVTTVEKLVYKRDMGFKTQCSQDLFLFYIRLYEEYIL